MAVVRSRPEAVAADEADVLAPVRARFVPPPGIYLAGNSLGALPTAVADAVADAVTGAWGRGLVSSWEDAGWWTLPRRVGDRIGSLIGAAPGQVVCGDSTSVQFAQAVSAMIRANPPRRSVTVDARDFPTDRFLADAVARLFGAGVERGDASELPIGDDTAVVACSAVDFATGELRDLEGITARAHDAGALMVWDLSHAAGAVPVDLDGLGADAAVGCTYKYLCGGPGAPAYLYVAHRHHDRLDLPLTGWQGHAEPFALSERYRPAPGIERARIGTPPVLAMVAADAALGVWEGVAMTDVRAKSLALADLVMGFVDDHLAGSGVEVATPRAHHRRGSQVSLRLPHAYEVSRALIERGVTGDFRAPDLLRLGLSPLYLSHVEVWEAMEALAGVVGAEAFRHPRYARQGRVVT